MRITTHRPITVCSIYIPQSHKLTLQQLVDLKNQLPKPYIITGTSTPTALFGAMNKPLMQGARFLKACWLKKNTHVLNHTSLTYLIISILKTTSVDLSLCSPGLPASLTWSTIDITWFSDTIQLPSTQPYRRSTTPLPYVNIQKQTGQPLHKNANTFWTLTQNSWILHKQTVRNLSETYQNSAPTQEKNNLGSITTALSR